MNIFKILSDGDGSIKEPNMSAFLSYLLDSSQGHGLGSRFIEKFIHKLVFSNKDKFERLKFDKKVSDLSSKSRFSLNITTEKLVELPNQKRRDIDVLVEIYEDDNDEPIYAICIENKIRDGALNKNQLVEEMIGLRNFYENEGYENIPEMSLVLVSPTFSDISNKAFAEFLGQAKENKFDVASCHIAWKPAADNKDSIFDQLSDILRLENEGLIDPIHEYTKYTIKSFMNFIRTDFKSYQEEKVESEGKYQKIRLTEVEYWELNKNSNVIDLAKQIKEFICDKYNIDVRPTRTCMSFYSDKIKDLLGTGYFFQLRCFKNKIRLQIKKDKKIRYEQFIETISNQLNIPNLSEQCLAAENLKSSTLYFNYDLCTEEDFENVGKKLLDVCYDYLTGKESK